MFQNAPFYLIVYVFVLAVPNESSQGRVFPEVPMSKTVIMLGVSLLEIVPSVSNVTFDRVCGSHIGFVYQGSFEAVSIQRAIVFPSAVTFSFGARGFLILIEDAFIMAGDNH